MGSTMQRGPGSGEQEATCKSRAHDIEVYFLIMRALSYGHQVRDGGWSRRMLYLVPIKVQCCCEEESQKIGANKIKKLPGSILTSIAAAPQQLASAVAMAATLSIISFSFLAFFLLFWNGGCSRHTPVMDVGSKRPSPTRKNPPLLSGSSSALFPNGTNITRFDFPQGFLFGSITSSMKHEGAELVDGKSLNIWDQYARTVEGASFDGSIPGQCGDSYYRYAEDHQLMVDLGMNAYRMSLAWSRIYPNGSGEVNELAIAHYNEVINDVLDRGLELFVTLWTQDHPYQLETDYMGPLNGTFIDDFAAYADTCFAAFGDRVKKWITFDEPNDWAGLGYATNQNPPGRCTSNIDIYGECAAGDSGIEPYIVGHHVILAHAEAVNIYRSKYQEAQNGSIGIALWHRWFEPLTDSPADLAAAQRATDFLLGWFLDPILQGDYPDSMKRYAGSRLPEFTLEEIAKVNGSIDFLGLNVITAFYAYDYNFYEDEYPNVKSYYLDPQAATTGEKDGVPIGVGKHDYAVPWIMRKTLEYIKYRYNNFPSYITQTGWGMEFTSEEDEANLIDDERVHFFETYYDELLNAIKEGANVKGVFAWSLLDGFEFNLGLEVRLGIHYVDHTLTRFARKSAEWFRLMLADNSTSTRNYL
ncbi:hypothetical protein GOP47_0012439 [Adiantum capillus-veneris]|uniref:Beta-glucosidase n=1 Tax=Adiantum capillus-veneris TaxID=13818 RepID=A0A9D4US17_ADICA|nr:hypothetical protein GOP47_0012439 [Adiantum capillus-veneris]